MQNSASIFLKFGFWFSLICAPALVWAIDPVFQDSEQAQKAKNRTYTGGRDEEPLQVQPSLPVVPRKMQPAQQPVATDSSGAATPGVHED